MARRGKAAHNRRKGVQRTSTGRLSRSKEAREKRLEMTEREALEVVMRQRMKAGMPEGFARDQKCGTVQGWLYAKKRISRDQYEAAEWFLTVRNEYHAAIDSPGTIWDRDDNRTSFYDPDAHESYCKRVRARWGEIEKAIIEAAFSNGQKRNIIGALDMLLVRQHVQSDLMEDLRYGLDAIHSIRCGKRKSDT